MKKRLLALLLALVMVCGLMPAAVAVSDDDATKAAQALYDLGLFQGTGTNADGTPNFDLGRTPTRAEAVTMLVRLLGKEGEAKAGTWATPFTDVDEWAKPYVGYAYANGLTTGTSATTFGGKETVDAAQYLTFVLRALGYESGKDFQWNAPWEKSDFISLTNKNYNADTSIFTRGDVAKISYKALSRRPKGGSERLSEVLGISLYNVTPEKLQGAWYTYSEVLGSPVEEEYTFSGNTYTFATKTRDSWSNNLGTIKSDRFHYETGTYQINGDKLIFLRDGDDKIYDKGTIRSTPAPFNENPREVTIYNFTEREIEFGLSQYEKKDSPQITDWVAREIESRPKELDTDLFIAKLDISDSIMAVGDLVIGNLSGKDVEISPIVFVDNKVCYLQGDAKSVTVKDGEAFQIPLYSTLSSEGHDPSKLYKIGPNSKIDFTLKWNGNSYHGRTDEKGNVTFNK